ncbi:cytochrome b561 and DOMON domain-containing protein At3g61750 [Cornus florida]|uniref:cytochrome b561 and DOMON domain-containing protein At3g61750 n=1 Tax=Cornus florida TaxID=4283 RepID=UPI00289E3300|nr:cytochrome b561 and DOMON domain-containing protein At3g61750 [Cornus florida]
MEYSRPRVSSLSRVLSFLTVLVFLLGPKVSAAVDDGDLETVSRCNVDLTTFLPFPYSNLSNVICKPVWNTFVIQYSQTEDHVVTILLSAVYTIGWVGMGFSKNGMMINSSAIVGWINKEGEARVRRYYLQGFEPSEVIPGRGELPITNIPAVVVLRGAIIYLGFQLHFAARLSRQPILLAFGSRYPTKHHHLYKHDDKTSFIFDFSAGSVSNARLAPDTIGPMKKTHGLLGLFGWGLILPSGAIVARYLKHRDPLWYYLHVIIQFVGFILGLAAVVVGVSLYDKLHANYLSHRGIGIFILVLSILQILAFFGRPNKDSKIRRYWNWYHHWFGRIALFFGAVNIVLGIQIGGAGNAWKIGYGFILATVLVTTIILEALSMMRKSEKTELPAFQMNPIQ